MYVSILVSVVVKWYPPGGVITLKFDAVFSRISAGGVLFNVPPVGKRRPINEPKIYHPVRSCGCVVFREGVLSSVLCATYTKTTNIKCRRSSLVDVSNGHTNEANMLAHAKTGPVVVAVV